MAKKTPVPPASEKRAKVEREAIRKAIDETEAPTKVEILQPGKRPGEMVRRDRRGR
jgi:hypothetical protein